MLFTGVLLVLLSATRCTGQSPPPTVFVVPWQRQVTLASSASLTTAPDLISVVHIQGVRTLNTTTGAVVWEWNATSQICGEEANLIELPGTSDSTIYPAGLMLLACEKGAWALERNSGRMLYNVSAPAHLSFGEDGCGTQDQDTVIQVVTTKQNFALVVPVNNTVMLLNALEGPASLVNVSNPCPFHSHWRIVGSDIDDKLVFICAESSVVHLAENTTSGIQLTEVHGIVSPSFSPSPCSSSTRKMVNGRLPILSISSSSLAVGVLDLNNLKAPPFVATEMMPFDSGNSRAVLIPGAPFMYILIPNFEAMNSFSLWNLNTRTQVIAGNPPPISDSPSEDVLEVPGSTHILPGCFALCTGRHLYLFNATTASVVWKVEFGATPTVYPVVGVPDVDVVALVSHQSEVRLMKRATGEILVEGSVSGISSLNPTFVGSSIITFPQTGINSYAWNNKLWTVSVSQALVIVLRQGDVVYGVSQQYLRAHRAVGGALIWESTLAEASPSASFLFNQYIIVASPNRLQVFNAVTGDFVGVISPHHTCHTSLVEGPQFTMLSWDTVGADGNDYVVVTTSSRCVLLVDRSLNQSYFELPESPSAGKVVVGKRAYLLGDSIVVDVGVKVMAWKIATGALSQIRPTDERNYRTLGAANVVYLCSNDKTVDAYAEIEGSRWSLVFSVDIGIDCVRAASSVFIWGNNNYMTVADETRVMTLQLAPTLAATDRLLWNESLLSTTASGNGNTDVLQTYGKVAITPSNSIMFATSLVSVYNYNYYVVTQILCAYNPMTGAKLWSTTIANQTQSQGLMNHFELGISPSGDMVWVRTSDDRATAFWGMDGRQLVQCQAVNELFPSSDDLVYTTTGGYGGFTIPQVFIPSRVSATTPSPTSLAPQATGTFPQGTPRPTVAPTPVPPYPNTTRHASSAFMLDALYSSAVGNVGQVIGMPSRFYTFSYDQPGLGGELMSFDVTQSATIQVNFKINFRQVDPSAAPVVAGCGTAQHPDGVVVLISDSDNITAMSALTGKFLWNETASILTIEETSRVLFLHMIPSMNFAVVVLSSGDTRAVAFNLTNGSIVWTYRHRGLDQSQSTSDFFFADANRSIGVFTYLSKLEVVNMTNGQILGAFSNNDNARTEARALGDSEGSIAVYANANEVTVHRFTTAGAQLVAAIPVSLEGSSFTGFSGSLGLWAIAGTVPDSSTGATVAYIGNATSLISTLFSGNYTPHQPTFLSLGLGSLSSPSATTVLVTDVEYYDDRTSSHRDQFLAIDVSSGEELWRISNRHNDNKNARIVPLSTTSNQVLLVSDGTVTVVRSIDLQFGTEAWRIALNAQSATDGVIQRPTYGPLVVGPFLDNSAGTYGIGVALTTSPTAVGQEATAFTISNGSPSQLQDVGYIAHRDLLRRIDIATGTEQWTLDINSVAGNSGIEYLHYFHGTVFAVSDENIAVICDTGASPTFTNIVLSRDCFHDTPSFYSTFAADRSSENNSSSIFAIFSGPQCVGLYSSVQGKQALRTVEIVQGGEVALNVLVQGHYGVIFSGSTIWTFDLRTGEQIWLRKIRVPDAIVFAAAAGETLIVGVEGSRELRGLNISNGNIIFQQELSGKLLSPIQAAENAQNPTTIFVWGNDVYVLLETSIARYGFSDLLQPGAQPGWSDLTFAFNASVRYSVGSGITNPQGTNLLCVTTDVISCWNVSEATPRRAIDVAVDEPCDEQVAVDHRNGLLFVQCSTLHIISIASNQTLFRTAAGQTAVRVSSTSSIIARQMSPEEVTFSTLPPIFPADRLPLSTVAPPHFTETIPENFMPVTFPPKPMPPPPAVTYLMGSAVRTHVIPIDSSAIQRAIVAGDDFVFVNARDDASHKVELYAVNILTGNKSWTVDIIDLRACTNSYEATMSSSTVDPDIMYVACTEPVIVAKVSLSQRIVLWSQILTGDQDSRGIYIPAPAIVSGNFSFLVEAEGMVFAMINDETIYATTLKAMNSTTGEVEWEFTGNHFFADATIVGRNIVLTSSHVAYALNIVTGQRTATLELSTTWNDNNFDVYICPFSAAISTDSKTAAFCQASVWGTTTLQFQYNISHYSLRVDEHGNFSSLSVWKGPNVYYLGDPDFVTPVLRMVHDDGITYVSSVGNVTAINATEGSQIGEVLVLNTAVQTHVETLAVHDTMSAMGKILLVFTSAFRIFVTSPYNLLQVRFNVSSPTNHEQSVVSSAFSPPGLLVFGHNVGIYTVNLTTFQFCFYEPSDAATAVTWRGHHYILGSTAALLSLVRMDGSGTSFEGKKFVAPRSNDGQLNALYTIDDDISTARSWHPNTGALRWSARYSPTSTSDAVESVLVGNYMAMVTSLQVIVLHADSGLIAAELDIESCPLTDTTFRRRGKIVVAGSTIFFGLGSPCLHSLDTPTMTYANTRLSHTAKDFEVDSISSPPRLIVIDWIANVYAIATDSSLTKVWETSVGYVSQGPTLTQLLSYIFVTTDATVVCLELNSGRRLWQEPVSFAPLKPVLLPSGDIAVASGSEVVAFSTMLVSSSSTNGFERKKWHVSFPRPLVATDCAFTTMMIPSNGPLLVGTTYHIFALHPNNGTVQWKRPLGAPLKALVSSDVSPIVLPVYADNDELTALDLADGMPIFTVGSSSGNYFTDAPRLIGSRLFSTRSLYLENQDRNIYTVFAADLPSYGVALPPPAPAVPSSTIITPVPTNFIPQGFANNLPSLPPSVTYPNLDCAFKIQMQTDLFVQCVNGIIIDVFPNGVPPGGLILEGSVKCGFAAVMMAQCIAQFVDAGACPAGTLYLQDILRSLQVSGSSSESER